ncbi:biotin biosynthesis protein BioC [Salmonella enterica subsp. arizonae]|uniref:Biotin biosynthesis protein BioC n=1 Tax=Salmonella enterica subsp. arizonae TaxID=59203 RepID=A0A379S6Z2_SALER|nr:biotin biosynthesis protein BioC [Salmonella enterica subsp. arizonae]
MAQVNKQAIAAAFGRAASQYEQHAFCNNKARMRC